MSEAEDKGMWSPGRIIATAVVFALVATVGYTLLAGRSGEKTSSKLTLPGAAPSTAATNSPNDFNVPTIDGRTIKLSDYRGKVLVMDFWATWCPPCQQETPQLARIARDNQARGLEVIGLHIDDRGRSSRSAIQKFIDNYGIPYTVGFATDDMFTSYLGTEDDTIPQTLVFGRDGRLIRHFIGYNAAHGKELDEVINQALAGS